MTSLLALLLALGLSLPFPPSFLASIEVYESPVQTHVGWLAYACYPSRALTYMDAPCPDTKAPSIVLEPLMETLPIGDRAALKRNLLAHEVFHLWAGMSGPRDDPFLERQAYRLGCYISWVPEYCPSWLVR